MGKKMTIDDLRKIKEQTKATTILREGGNRGRVTVHMGTCGIAAGSREVLNAFLNEFEQRSIKDIHLTTSSCAGLCSHEPMATVEMLKEPPVKYVNLDREKAIKILDEHVLGGEIVTEYVLAVGGEISY